MDKQVLKSKQGHLGGYSDQNRATQTKASLEEQKAQLAAEDPNLVSPSQRADFVPEPSGHQMTPEELQAEYDAARKGEMKSERGDEFDMPPMDRTDPYVPEVVEPAKAKPVSQLAKRREEPQLPERLFAPAGEMDLAGEAGIVSAIAREEAELKAAIVMARQHPRNEAEAEGAIRRACGRPTFAAVALYSYSRGETKIVGPSVNLARTLAVYWQNLRDGTRVVSEDENSVHLKGYCFDVENNHYVEHENKFAKLIQRKVGKGPTAKTVWIKPDERDLRELVSRQGAFLHRNSILESIPRDVVDLAIDLCKETQRKGAAADPVGETKRLLAGFAAIGVHAQEIESRYEHPVEALTAEELVELRQIFASIRDGQSTRAEHFFVGITNGEPEGEGSRTARLTKKLNGRK